MKEFESIQYSRPQFLASNFHTKFWGLCNLGFGIYQPIVHFWNSLLSRCLRFRNLSGVFCTSRKNLQKFEFLFFCPTSLDLKTVILQLLNGRAKKSTHVCKSETPSLNWHFFNSSNRYFSFGQIDMDGKDTKAFDL